MPRTARAAKGGVIYHISNSGHGRGGLFRNLEDYLAFVELLIEAGQHASIEIYGFCLLPNEWRLLVRPRRAADLAAYIAWVSNTHVKRFMVRYPRTHGHVYKGRYKSFPVEKNQYFLSVMRHLETAAPRAKLVTRAADWPWSSLGLDKRLGAALLSRWPVDRPKNWWRLVDQPMEKRELDMLSTSLKRARPFGSDRWIAKIAEQTGAQHTLRPIGRPRKSPK
jgi:putative transposase